MRRFITTGAALAALTLLPLAAAPAMADDPAPAAATPASDAAGDAAAGEKTFAVCKACHQIGPNAHNAVGPVLSGVVGRKAGTYPGYSYSEANKNSGLTWDVATLQKYLAGPQKLVPGTKMIYPGFPNNPEKSNNVIAYLSQFNEDGSKK